MTLNFDNYSDILVLSGAGFGIYAGLPDYNGMHQMADEAVSVHNIEPYMIEHPSFYEKKSCWCLGYESKSYEYISYKKTTRRL